MFKNLSSQLYPWDHSHNFKKGGGRYVDFALQFTKYLIVVLHSSIIELSLVRIYD
jgi:hypothetical protein